jgi:hypothetical protein
VPDTSGTDTGHRSDHPTLVEFGQGVQFATDGGTRMRQTGWLQAGTVLVAMTLAAGCGGVTQTGTATPAPTTAVATPPAPDPIEQIVAATDATLAAGTTRFTMNVDLTGGGNSAALVDGSGSADLNAQAAEMEMFVAQQPGAPLRKVRTIMAGGTVYQQPDGHDRWFAIDARAVGAQSDPAEQIRQFRDAAKDVRDVGTVEVRGQQMRHYQLTLNPSAQPGATAAPLPPGGVPADLYLDDQGRFARFETRTPAPDQTTVVMTMDFTDYGIPVSIQAPDPGLVDPMPR